MGLFGQAKNALKLGYEAVTQTKARKAYRVERRTEDSVLDPANREKLIAAVRDLRRNESSVAWAIRTHQNNTCVQKFQAGTAARRLKPSDPNYQKLIAFYDQLEKLIKRWMRAENCDVLGRFNFDQLVRMNEGLCQTDGDSFRLLLPDGKTQIIEGDRVRNPSDRNAVWKTPVLDADGTQKTDATGQPLFNVEKIDWSTWTHGVETSPEGKPRRYAICARDGTTNNYVLKTIVTANVMIPLADIEVRHDMVRGVSRWAPAVNDFTDLHEANAYQLRRMMLDARFALKFKRKGEYSDDTNDAGTTDINLDDGSAAFDMYNDDDVDFMSSQSPADQWQNWYMKRIANALKASNIPFSQYDEAYTNYSGQRQAAITYGMHAANDRERIICFRNRLTDWRIALWVADGTLKPEDAGLAFEDIEYEWVSVGAPWLDPQKEAQGKAVMLANNLTSEERICREQGLDLYQIVDERQAFQQYMREKGYTTPAEPKPVKAVDPNGGTNE